MAKINKWKTQAEVDAEKLAKEELKTKKENLKSKPFNTLSRAEKDDWLEIILKEHELI